MTFWEYTEVIKKLKNLKHKIINYKFLSTLNLVALNLIVIQKPSTSMIRNIATSSLRASKSITPSVNLNPNSLSTQFFYGSGGRRIPVSSNANILSTNIPSTSTNSSISSPIRTQNQQIFYGSNGKRTIISTYVTTPTIQPKTTPNTKITYSSFLFELKKDINDIIETSKTINQQLKLNIKEANNSIIQTSNESLTKMAESSLSNTKVLKQEIQSNLQTQQERANQAKIDFKDLRQSIIQTTHKSLTKVAEASSNLKILKQEIHNTLQNQQERANRIKTDFK